MARDVAVLVEYGTVQYFDSLTDAIYLPIKLANGVKVASVRYHFVTRDFRNCVVPHLLLGERGFDSWQQQEHWNLARNDSSRGLLSNRLFVGLVVAIEIA